MQLKTYKNASNIEEKYLSDLAQRQAECWWAKPFEEYKICKNENCRALFSIEEVLWNVMEIRNPQSSEVDFRCTECWDETEEIYEKEKFIMLMKEYFLWKVSWLLVIDEKDSVEGFGFVTKTNIRELMEFEFNTRPSSYNIEESIKKLWEILYEDEHSENQEIICFNQIYLSPLVRSSKLSYEAFKTLFEINKDEYWDIPLVWDTRYDNKFYPIIRSIWAENLLHDKHWYSLQILSKYWYILDFLYQHNGYQDFLWEMIKFKKEARTILKKYPELTGRKFYK